MNIVKIISVLTILMIFSCQTAFAVNNKIHLPDERISINKLPVKYPIIEQMELKILGKTYINDDIAKRLDRLEIAVFHGVNSDNLSNRVEKLKTAILNKQEKPKEQYEEENVDNPAMDADSINALLDKLETETFKTTYPNESTESRLDRLENKIFNNTSSDNSISNRIERLSAVITAQPSNDLYKDASQLRQYQQVGTGITAAAILLLLIRGLFL